MKNIFIVFMICFLTMSCSLFKKVTRTQAKTETNSEVIISQRTKTTETETRRVDTSYHVAESNIQANKPAQNILEGDSLVADNDEVNSMVTYDKQTGNLKVETKVKAKDIPVKINEVKTKTTETEAGATVKNDKKEEQKATAKKIVSWSSAIWLFALVPVAAVGYYYRKKIPIINRFFS